MRSSFAHNKVMIGYYTQLPHFFHLYEKIKTLGSLLTCTQLKQSETTLKQMFRNNFNLLFNFKVNKNSNTLKWTWHFEVERLVEFSYRLKGTSVIFNLKNIFVSVLQITVLHDSLPLLQCAQTMPSLFVAPVPSSAHHSKDSSSSQASIYFSDPVIWCHSQRLHSCLHSLLSQVLKYLLLGRSQRLISLGGCSQVT